MADGASARKLDSMLVAAAGTPLPARIWAWWKISPYILIGTASGLHSPKVSEWRSLLGNWQALSLRLRLPCDAYDAQSRSGVSRGYTLARQSNLSEIHHSLRSERRRSMARPILVAETEVTARFAICQPGPTHPTGSRGAHPFFSAIQTEQAAPGLYLGSAAQSIQLLNLFWCLPD